MQLTKVGVLRRQLLLDISLGDHAKVERVVQEVVVEGEFTAFLSAPVLAPVRYAAQRILRWRLLLALTVPALALCTGRKVYLRRDDVDTGSLDRLPSLLTDSLGLSLELFLGDLASPVGLDRLYKLTMPFSVSHMVRFLRLLSDSAVQAHVPSSTELGPYRSHDDIHDDKDNLAHLLDGTVHTDTGVTKDSRLDHFRLCMCTCF